MHRVATSRVIHALTFTQLHRQEQPRKRKNRPPRTRPQLPRRRLQHPALNLLRPLRSKWSRHEPPDEKVWGEVRPSHRHADIRLHGHAQRGCNELRRYRDDEMVPWNGRIRLLPRCHLLSIHVLYQKGARRPPKSLLRRLRNRRRFHRIDCVRCFPDQWAGPWVAM